MAKKQTKKGGKKHSKKRKQPAPRGPELVEPERPARKGKPLRAPARSYCAQGIHSLYHEAGGESMAALSEAAGVPLGTLLSVHGGRCNMSLENAARMGQYDGDVNGWVAMAIEDWAFGKGIECEVRVLDSKSLMARAAPVSSTRGKKSPNPIRSAAAAGR